MTACLGFFGAKGRAECVRSAESRGGRFVIKLAALRQICLVVAEIIDLKKCRRAFACGGRKYRRIGEREAVIVEIIARCLDHGMADLQNRMLLFRTDPKVPMIHKELGAVFLRRDRIISRVVNDIESRYVQFDADG
jgi:hypothetical protein